MTDQTKRTHLGEFILEPVHQCLVLFKANELVCDDRCYAVAVRDERHEPIPPILLRLHQVLGIRVSDAVVITTQISMSSEVHTKLANETWAKGDGDDHVASVSLYFRSSLMYFGASFATSSRAVAARVDWRNLGNKCGF